MRSSGAAMTNDRLTAALTGRRDFLAALAGALITAKTVMGEGNSPNCAIILDRDDSLDR